jgi:hypothetical protein
MADSRTEAHVKNFPDFGAGLASHRAPAAPTEERRKLRRARLRLRARMRPGEFDDGAFEEVVATLNASRKAFYFHTKSDRYRTGMRLHVNFPHDPEANSCQVDDIGEVIRVERMAGGYGVAVTFWKAGDAPVSATQPIAAREDRCGDAERRSDPRHPVVAAVELIDLPTGLKARATTCDLGLGGCYVNTLNPFWLGATLGVKIEHGGKMLVAEASVCTRFVGSGMGLAFRNVSAEQLAILAEWLPVENAVPAGYQS